jgi:hypothetical protein
VVVRMGLADYAVVRLKGSVCLEGGSESPDAAADRWRLRLTGEAGAGSF